ncbi:hypothetical protein A0J61_01773 [Choanephora cucurbitarum]|uniref:Uncharacterized protein n=1 Tax=Choanephora cucurbitarum TaxID=101091 RepID=A0A1C7NM38_9FUNG|nr:hypothetical protein A0J61_01773 [Choanephora cucurbitarum]
MSHFEKETVYEVVLDAHGVAQRVPKGQGTHIIHVSANKETRLEEKTEFNADKWKQTTPTYSKRIHPTTETTPKEEVEKTGA